LSGGVSSLAKKGRAPLFAAAVQRAQSKAEHPLQRTPRLLKYEGSADEPRLIQQLRGIRAVLVLVAAIGVIFFVHYARELLIPVVAALVIAAILGPVVEKILRVIPYSSIAAAIAIVGSLLIVGGATYAVSDDLATALERLPEISRQLKERVNLEQPSSNPVKKIAEAAQNLEEAANSMSAAAAPKSGRPVPKSEISPEARPSWFRSQLMAGSTTIAQGLAELSVAFLIAYFILASGPLLRRKLFRASGYHRRQRLRFRRILYQSCKQVRLYVLIVLVTNVAIGLGSWAVFYLLGFDHAGLWAVFAGIVHIVPYVGSIALAAATVAFHYLSSGSVLESVNYGLLILVVVSLLGTLLPTWLQSRTSRMNQVAVFVGIMFWGWMWGLWGLFLGAPIVVIMKVVCDNVTALRGTARLLGD
jgi:predicted PurR-regulated permease PerM